MPTSNPVPSQDPSDLLFNAEKLDEVVNGTANSFTDRLGVARRTVAGMNADFDAQLADAKSDLNVYRADAAASAAEALGYLQTIRATSYGAYASDPATDPLGNPPTVGDEYFNTTANLLKRWNGTTWQASDINTANLAASSGSSLVGYSPAGTGAVATTVQSKLRETVSLKDFGATAAASAAVNTAAINAAFASGAKRVAGEAGAVYAVNGQISISSSLEFDGRGCTFSATLAAGVRLLQVTAAASIKNLTLDFNDGYALNAINFPIANVGYLELVNVVVRDIYDLDTTSLTIPINFNADLNEIRFDGVTLKNIKKRSNGNSTDTGGGIEGFYVFAGTSGAVGGGGYMRNITIENIRTVDASGADVEDICNAIYFAYAGATDRRTRIAVENVKALDFGRRLFKTQCDDLFISNVFAEASTLPAFVAIGIQDYDTYKAYNVKVKDAIIRGKIRFGVAVSADDVLLDGIDMNISLAGTNSVYGNSAIGISISGDNLTIANSFIRSKVALFGNRASTNFAGLIKGLIVDSCNIKTNETGSQFFDIGSITSLASVDSAVFNNVVFDASDYPANGGSGGSFIGNTTNLSNVVSFNNCVTIDNDAAANGGSQILVYGAKTVNITGYTHFNRNATSAVYRSFRFNTCTSIVLHGINLQAKPSAASIDFNNITSLIAGSIYGDSTASYFLSISTTTNSRVSNVNRAKVALNDTASMQGCLFAPEFSAGTTSQRPTAGLIAGQQYWDTTLGKPIWWTGAAWKDAAGTTV